MSIFSKKEKKEKEKDKEKGRTYFAFEEPAEEGKISFGTSRNPDMLTPEEILRRTDSGEDADVPSSALEKLKKRMKAASGSADEEPETDVIEIEKKEETVRSVEEAIEEVAGKAEERAAKQEEPADAEEKPADPDPSEEEKTPEEKTGPEMEEKDPGAAFLDRCRIYTVDENGNDSAAEEGPAYELESVADILKAQSEDTMERLSKQYDIPFDELGKVTDDGMALDPALTEEPDEEPEGGKEEDGTDAPAEEPHGDHAVISDFEEFSPPVSAGEESGATVRFTPVAGEGHASKISVSSTTKTVDLTGELTEFSTDASEEPAGEIQLERTEFDEYAPALEYHTKEDVKAVKLLLAKKRRSSFLKMATSFFLTLIPAVFCLPFLSGVVLGHMRLFTILSLIATGGTVLIQWDMAADLRKMIGRHATADTAAVLASLTVLVYAVTGIVLDENVIPVLLMLSFALLIRAVGCFFRDSALFSNFEQIALKAPKQAVKLIRDPAVTFAMAKNSIEGDVLIAAPQKADHVDDYMKYSTFRVFLGGRMTVVAVAFAVLALILGLASATYFKGAIYGLYSAAAVLCLCATPILFLIEDLPLFSAAKRLNRIGAMIAGKTGAEFIADANALVLTSEDLFPAGTVTLYQMKVLSENSMDDTIIRAAALTEAMGSPLASVFKKIAASSGNVTLPEADTVKYEDKMGISGWVDDRLLFVGNRTLMEAHGIRVPDIETDRKLLRSGYFPVYVSDDQKACVLLAVQYGVDDAVARELRKLSGLGITLLIKSSDPNMTEEMICDYMGLYEDSVKVMTSAGCHMYGSAVAEAQTVSAPAAYRGGPVGLSSIVTTANRIRKANTKLTVLYLLSAVLGAILFTYMSFDGKGSPVGGELLLLYEGICTALSMLIYFFEKP